MISSPSVKCQPGLCFGCLENGHSSKECKSRLICEICEKNHPTPLHGFTKFKPAPASVNNVLVDDKDKGKKKPDSKGESKEMTVSNNVKSGVSLFAANGDSRKSTMIVPVLVSCSKKSWI